MNSNLAKSNHGLKPNCPLSLDTARQRAEYDEVKDAAFIETVLKLHGLFTPHMVLHESNVLAHAGMMNFFGGLSPTIRGDVISYLTLPGKDPLKMAPVVVATEFREGDPTSFIPLRELLAMKLGSENSSRYWLFEACPAPRREALNSQIPSAEPKQRVELALKYLGDIEGQYDSYLKIISAIWDGTTGPNRWNLRPPDYRGRLSEMLRIAEAQLSRGEKETALILQRDLSVGNLVFPNGEKEQNINRSTVTRWLEGKFASECLRSIVNRAHPESFVCAFPANRGSLSSNYPHELGFWKSADPNAPRKRKRSPQAALDVVTRTYLDIGGPLRLDQISFKHLRELRASDEFQDSLSVLQDEWESCSNLDHFHIVLKNHVELIYKMIGAHKRSSTISEAGGKPYIESMSQSQHLLEIERAIEAGGSSMHTGFSWHLASTLLGPVMVAIDHFIVRPGAKKRRWHQLASLVVRSSIADVPI